MTSGTGTNTTITEYNLLDKASTIKTKIDTTLENVVHQEYDKNDNLIKTLYQNGSFVSYEYDFSNKVVNKSITDALKGTTTTHYEYDTNGNLVKTILPNSKVISYEYDLYDRLIKEIDTLGNYKFYVYDSANRLIATQIWTSENVMLSEVINSYNEAGKVIETKLKNLEKNEIYTTTYSYDLLGQVTKTTNTL
jgi:YD repeat-containing protein